MGQSKLMLISSTAAAISISLVMVLLWLRKRRRVDSSRKTVLFFPNFGETYKVLSDTIKSAQTSIDVCVYTISSKKLVDILINAHCNGVIVRVITDCEQETISGGQVWRLRQTGIQVRTNNSSYLMHHKFCVVDNLQLINGSLNWTSQGVECNEENVIVTDDVVYVKQFSDQFNKLWDHYDPNKTTMHD